MSVSSGSDVTIPIQDSPPPPPSPYANRTGDATGIENKGFNSESSEMSPQKTKGGSEVEESKERKETEINMGSAGEGKVTEAVNSELINMNIMNTIPARPMAEFGPYEQMDDYFIPVNTHKKFLRRSEKLYVTKDKRKERSVKKYLCWIFGAFLLAAIVAVAVLAALGIIPQTSEPNTISGSGSIVQIEVSTTPPSVFSTSTAFTTSRTTTGKPITISPDNTYVSMAADVVYHITNLNYEAALNNKSSEQFSTLATKIQTQMKDLLKEKADLDGVQIRIVEFAPGSVVVKMRIGWMKESMDFDTIHFRLANVTTFGDFEIKELSSYKVVNHCKFNNNGCSHFCIYDSEFLEFSCTCPETMLLDSDSKTCKDATVPVLPSSTISSEVSAEPSAEPEVPAAEPESPAPEPETPSEDSTAEPEPETSPEEAAVVSSSVAPDTEIPALSTSTTTGAPRLEDIDADVPSHDDSQVVPTTVVTPTDEEPVPETPVDSETQDHVDQAVVSTSTSTTTTTEVPIVVELPVESETHSPEESEPIPEAPSHEESQTDSREQTGVETERTSGSDETTISPALIVEEESTSKSVDTVEEPAESREGDSNHSNLTILPTNQTAEDHPEIPEVHPVDLLMSTSTSTTTEVPVITSSSSTTPSPIIIAEESQTEREEPILLNLQRDSSELSQESSVESPQSPDTSASLERIPPTSQPNSQEVSGSVEESGVSNNSSERTGRQESYSEQQALISRNSAEDENKTERIAAVVRPTPSSAEFMHYGDTHPVQTSLSPIHPLLNSKELTGSEEAEGGSSVSTSEESLPLALPQEEGSREEVTTFAPISLHRDIDINNSHGTNTSLLSESVESESKESVVAGERGIETTVISIEEEAETEAANRDHRETGEVDSTLSPVVFDEEEGGTTSQPDTTPSTTPAPQLTSSTLKTISSDNQNGNEVENELR